MGESRTELLAWLNDLLQINYTKVEQCGSGAAYCGVIDSVFLDVPLSKVKFNAKHEYEYVANFKVLQDACKRHKIDRVRPAAPLRGIRPDAAQVVPVERLVKCKVRAILLVI